uniref:tetratricopeptide repeat protein n=1 Tax=Ningiella ruwaisensis TaxID=2364274 RepID=UPI00109F87AF|nr:tetratricopeptide repeat protein [Ningiella ruwaisensis]
MKRFLSELKRREVIKPLLAYLGLAWLLLQVVGLVTGFLNLHPLVGPATLLIFVCGFPIACYLSWHFDFTMDGIKRTPGIDEEFNPRIEPFGPKNWIGLSAIFVISAFIGIQYFESISDQQRASSEGLSTIKTSDSLAVLPFSDQSPEKDQGYLAVGLAEEITSLLGSADGFKVSASRSGQILTERGLTPVDIGKRLEVDTVLTGSVRASGNRIRVRVELLDTENGRTLWSESFLRELKDVFELESEISRAVVNLLQDRYLEAGELKSLSSTESVDAYVMYLKGREAYRKQSTESMKQARKYFEQAIALDPEYAAAYVGLADTIALLSEGAATFGILKSEIASTLAERNLEKAIVREPEIAQIYAVMGLVKYLRKEYEDSFEAFDKALEINPSLAIAYMWKSASFIALQRYDEAIEEQIKARELDPLFITNTYNLGVQLLWQGKVDEAKQVFINLKEDHPDSSFPFQGLADVYFREGKFAASIKELLFAIERSPENTELEYRLNSSLLNLGLVDILKSQTSDPIYDSTMLIFEERFDELFNKMEFELEANPDDYWIAFESGWYHAMFGKKETAIYQISHNYEQLEDFDKYTMPFCSPAIEVAWTDKITENLQRFESTLTKCSKLLQNELSWSFTFYTTARLHALKGDSSQALVFLQKSVDAGWREWWTKYDPLLEGINNDAEYKALIRFIDEDLARQAKEVRQLFEE